MRNEEPIHIYDTIIIGAGPAGYELAGLLAEGGRHVCLIEKTEQNVGGTCLTEGCVPAKHFLESAGYIAKASHFSTCGVEMKLKRFEIEKLKASTESLIAQQQDGILSSLKRQKVEIVYGTASFVDSETIQLAESGERLTAEQIVIATGSRHRDHPSIALVEGKILSSREVFEIDHIPASLLVIGAGAIGCEFASFFHAMGAEVTLAEYAKVILPIEEPDLSRTLKRELERKGITVHVDAEVTAHTVREEGVEVQMRVGKKELEGSYEMLLIAVGRAPNTDTLGLEKAAVESERGFVSVDGQYCSLTNPKVYAIGDVITTPALAHVAYYEAKCLSRILLDHTPMEPSPIFPSVTFTTPQVASIGASEAALKVEGRAIKSKKRFFKANAKAKIKGDDSGFVKVTYDPETEVILGAAIIGNDATELIHQFLIAINKQVTLGELGEMIFAHPTLSELIGELSH